MPRSDEAFFHVECAQLKVAGIERALCTLSIELLQNRVRSTAIVKVDGVPHRHQFRHVLWVTVLEKGHINIGPTAEIFDRRPREPNFTAGAKM